VEKGRATGAFHRRDRIGLAHNCIRTKPLGLLSNVTMSLSGEGLAFENSSETATVFSVSIASSRESTGYPRTFVSCARQWNIRADSSRYSRWFVPNRRASSPNTPEAHQPRDAASDGRNRMIRQTTLKAAHRQFETPFSTGEGGGAATSTTRQLYG
jgi:hypothetical protein